MKLIGVVLIFVLLIVLIVNTKETYLNYADILNDLKENTATDNKCQVLEDLKERKKKNNFVRMPCSSINELQNLTKECRESYCKEMPYCNLKDSECISECELISRDSGSETNKKKKCLEKEMCNYDSNYYDKKKRCNVSELKLHSSNVSKVKDTCDLINDTCDDNKNCIKNFCKLNRYCEVKNNKCVIKDNINLLENNNNTNINNNIAAYYESSYGAPKVSDYDYLKDTASSYSDNTNANNTNDNNNDNNDNNDNSYSVENDKKYNKIFN